MLDYTTQLGRLLLPVLVRGTCCQRLYVCSVVSVCWKHIRFIEVSAVSKSILCAMQDYKLSLLYTAFLLVIARNVTSPNLCWSPIYWRVGADAGNMFPSSTRSVYWCSSEAPYCLHILHSDTSGPSEKARPGSEWPRLGRCGTEVCGLAGEEGEMPLLTHRVCVGPPCRTRDSADCCRSMFIHWLRSADAVPNRLVYTSKPALHTGRNSRSMIVHCLLALENRPNLFT